MVAGNDCFDNNYDLSVLSNKTSIFIFADSISTLVLVCCISEFYDIQVELNHCRKSDIYYFGA